MSDASAAGAVPAGATVAPARRRHRVWLLGLPPILFLFIFFALPYLNMLYISFLTKGSEIRVERVYTLANYARTFGDPFNWRILFNTIWYSVAAAVLTLIVSYPLAYQLARASSRRRGIYMMLLLAPLLIGVVIRSYGWMIILSDTGLINQFLLWIGVGRKQLMYNLFGVMVGLVQIYMPFMVLAIAGSLQSIHPDVELAARSLGGSPWRAFWRVTWPLSMPGVYSGTLLVFILAVSSYVIPILLGGSNILMAPQMIVQMVLDAFNWPLGAAMAMWVFLVVVSLVAIYVRLMSRVLRWTA